MFVKKYRSSPFNSITKCSCLLYSWKTDVNCSFKQPTRRSQNLSSAPIWTPPLGPHVGLQIYNCIARQTVPLAFPNSSHATWYTCGPTVYDKPHLGHASCYVKLDILQRILREHFRINLVTAMNITDIDDKIINKSLETNRNWKHIALQYENEFFEDLRRLKVREPDIIFRVTENMGIIISFIKELIAKGNAYVGKDGSVYFNVKNYPAYGKLQNIDLEQSGELPPEENDKMFRADFALWKAKKQPNEPSWSSPWGEGRPGWHIECSALASKIFGSNIDIHAGGIDLRFPHHENEDAQSCAFHGTNQWVNYWLHTGHLHIKGDTNKMSKSLKNTISVDEMLQKYDSDDFRMACLLSNYKKSMEYSSEMMETASNTLRKFKTFQSDCLAYISGAKPATNINSSVLRQNLEHTAQEVNTGLCDDFNTAYTVNVLLDQISGISRCINNQNTTGVIESSCIELVAAANNYVQSIFDMYGMKIGIPCEVPLTLGEEIDVRNMVSGIIDSRKSIREKALDQKCNVLFEVCDEIRNCLQKYGIEIKDHGRNSTWEFISRSAKQAQKT